MRTGSLFPLDEAAPDRFAKFTHRHVASSRFSAEGSIERERFVGDRGEIALAFNLPDAIKSSILASDVEFYEY